MKSISIAVYSLCLAAGLMAARADDAQTAPKDSAAPAAGASSTTPHSAPATRNKRPALTTEQKAARKELLSKYDKNNDGKLDKDEFASISKEDKAKLKKAGYATRVRKIEKKN